MTCARERFKGHPGTFGLVGKTIAYSYETPNGVGKVIVNFNEKHRPEQTFFESTPFGTHEELMDAAQAIKECAEYGRKARAMRPHLARLLRLLKSGPVEAIAAQKVDDEYRGEQADDENS